MKISKKSWHYRWMKKIGFSVPDNLCAYFWTAVWSGLVFPVAASAAVLAATILSLPLWAWLMSGYEVQAIATFIAIMEVAGLTIWLFAIADDRRRVAKWAAIHDGTYNYPKPSLFKAWLRARHEKVCPYLTFED